MLTDQTNELPDEAQVQDAQYKEQEGHTHGPRKMKAETLCAPR